MVMEQPSTSQYHRLVINQKKKGIISYEINPFPFVEKLQVWFFGVRLLHSIKIIIHFAQSDKSNLTKGFKGSVFELP